MAQTVELALVTATTRTVRGGVSYEECDVVVVRPPLGRLGRREAREFLWMRGTIPDDLVRTPHEGAGESLIRKGRFNISMATLQVIMPTFEPARARDPNDVYQPFLNLTLQAAGDYTFTARSVPALTSRIFDKQEGRTR
jgi:hypothetical protein